MFGYFVIRATCVPSSDAFLAPTIAGTGLEIQWPSGRKQLLEHVKADQVLTLVEPDQ